MNSKIAIQRSKQALEKQDTNAFANLTNWDYEDSYNKALTDWYRRQDWGTNQRREGEESSEMITDDLQVFLTSKKLSVSNYEIFGETAKLPLNYRYYNRLALKVEKDGCIQSTFPSKFRENANVDVLLSDWNTQPSFDFEQAFHVLLSNKFKVYTNGDFKILSAELYYFKAPKKISCELKDMEVEWEVKEDVAELIIDEAIKNLGGNIQHITAAQTAENRTTINN